MPSALPFPADLEAIAPAGWLSYASPEEIGALYLLARAAWSDDPAGTLPDDDVTLARITRAPAELWQAIRARLSPFLRHGAHPGRLLLEPVARLHARELEEANRRRERTRRASVSRWSAGPEPPPDPRPRSCPDRQESPSRIRDASVTDARRTASALSSSGGLSPLLRPTSSGIDSSARAPEGSIHDAGARGRGEESIIAALGAGAEQKARFALWEWERSLVVQMVQDAIGRWTQAGLTRCPADKAQEIAAGKYSSGDRVQYVIETIDGMIKAAAKGQEPNPIGVLIAHLGLNRRGRIRVVDTPMFVTQRWDAKREIQRKLLLANAALIEATARRSVAAAQTRGVAHA